MIIIRIVALACAALVAAGCSATAPPSAAPTATPATAGAVTSEQRALVERFVTAINSGDQAAVRDSFVEEARFDSVGRVYEGRDEIMGRFLVPEVIRVAGRYKLLSLTAGDGGRVVAEYDFTTGGGGREHFTYACTLREGRFADCLGRYV